MAVPSKLHGNPGLVLMLKMGLYMLVGLKSLTRPRNLTKERQAESGKGQEIRVKK